MSMTREPPIDEREWQAQERGMRAARGQASAETDTSNTAGTADMPTAHYRAVAHALRTAPGSEPPIDFAISVAGLATPRSDAGLERTLSRILLAVFAVSSLVVLALYAPRGWQSVRQAFDGDGLAWLLAGIGCLLVSWVFAQLRAIEPAGLHRVG